MVDAPKAVVAPKAVAVVDIDIDIGMKEEERPLMVVVLPLALPPVLPISDACNRACC